MADPVTAIAGIGLASSAAGSIFSAFGSQREGEAKANMFNYQASVARVNQDIAKQNAAYARDVGEVEAQKVGMKGRFEEGQAKAAQSGRGLDVNTGSAALTRSSMELVSAHEQDVTRANAAKRAYGYEVEGMSQGAQATMYGLSAQDAQRAGQMGFMTSLLGGASSVSSKWMQGRSSGVFS